MPDFNYTFLVSIVRPPVAVLPSSNTDINVESYSIFSKALKSLNCVAIVRYVKTDNGLVKLGALFPNDDEYLTFCEVCLLIFS